MSDNSSLESPASRGEAKDNKPRTQYERLCDKHRNNPEMLAWLKREVLDKKMSGTLSEDADGNIRYTTRACMCGQVHIGWGMCSAGRARLADAAIKPPTVPAAMPVIPGAALLEKAVCGNSLDEIAGARRALTQPRQSR